MGTIVVVLTFERGIGSVQVACQCSNDQSIIQPPPACYTEDDLL